LAGRDRSDHNDFLSSAFAHLWFGKDDMPQPLYQPAKVDGAYQLRYSWTSWPSAGVFPSETEECLRDCETEWERDGMRLLECQVQPTQCQVTFSVRPACSPQFLCARAKGRLDHVLRVRKLPLDFSRKISLRSLGDSKRDTLDSYLAQQAVRESFVDPDFERQIAQLAFVDAAVDLSQPQQSARGRYWNNLHLVLVTVQRQPLRDLEILRNMVGTVRIIAKAKGYGLHRASPMLDHLHLTLRVPFYVAPVEVVFAFQNNLAYMLNLGRVWAESYYIGTFGEYGMGAVRR